MATDSSAIQLLCLGEAFWDSRAPLLQKSKDGARARNPASLWVSLEESIFMNERERDPGKSLILEVDHQTYNL